MNAADERMVPVFEMQVTQSVRRMMPPADEDLPGLAAASGEDINNKMVWLQSTGGLLRAQPMMLCPAHSDGKPGVSSTVTKINVRFAPDSLLQLEIKPTRKKDVS
jgi:hypothetical protein